MIDNGTLNYCWSDALIAGFIAAGVSDAIISPGSRSTPLALAMLRQPGLRCHVVIDERSAAFFALGIAKASRNPVLLLATSGTAPANWLPAVIEASQSCIPLILLSADRPPELQNCGANQTIDQIGLFGSHVRASHAMGTPAPDFDADILHRLAARAIEQSQWPHPGPVHINQPFREPLIPATATAPAAIPQKIYVASPRLVPANDNIRDFAGHISGRPGVIVCGEMPHSVEDQAAIVRLATRLNCPILAEPLSGLRFGLESHAQRCVRYNDWLSDADFCSRHAPQWVLRFGAYPVTRNLQHFVAGVDGPHAVVDGWPRWSDPAHRLTHLLRGEPAAVCTALLEENPLPAPAAWAQAFIDRDNLTPAATEADHIGILINELRDGTHLFVGNSLAIRQIDTHSGWGQKAIHFHGNRGASGIDGNISTAMGIAEVHGAVVALIGDLTCQHDLGGLVLAQGRNAVIVTVNNQGGGIFDYLPQHALPEFEQGWRTPQQISFEHAALTFGLAYAGAESNEAFRSALRTALNAGGPHLIELKLP